MNTILDQLQLRDDLRPIVLRHAMECENTPPTAQDSDDLKRALAPLCGHLAPVELQHGGQIQIALLAFSELVRARMTGGVHR